MPVLVLLVLPRRTHHFDVKTGKWSKVIELLEGPFGYDNKAPMVYDSVSKMCFIVEDKSIWSYRVGDKKWNKITPIGMPNNSRRAFMACYNSEYNVIMADSGSGKIWIYRGKKK